MNTCIAAYVWAWECGATSASWRYLMFCPRTTFLGPMGCMERQHRHLLVAQPVRIERHRRLHGQDRQHLEQFEVEPGHDAWVVGDEAVTSVEFSGAESYAKKG